MHLIATLFGSDWTYTISGVGFNSFGVLSNVTIGPFNSCLTVLRNVSHLNISAEQICMSTSQIGLPAQNDVKIWRALLVTSFLFACLAATLAIIVSRWRNIFVSWKRNLTIAIVALSPVMYMLASMAMLAFESDLSGSTGFSDFQFQTSTSSQLIFVICSVIISFASLAELYMLRRYWSRLQLLQQLPSAPILEPLLAAAIEPSLSSIIPPSAPSRTMGTIQGRSYTLAELNQ